MTVPKRSCRRARGSSNYVLPANADLTQLSSMSIWCDRLDVSFGAAALEPVAP